MKKLALLFVTLLALAFAGSTVACVAAGHGGVNNCTLPQAPDTSQHCFVGKARATPKIGSSYTLDVTAFIQPTFLPSLISPCAGRAVSAWVMTAGSTNFIQVGYWMDCNWNGSLYYFQTTYDGAYHNTLLWPWPGNRGDLFTVRRTAGTNTFQSYINGTAYFPPVTLANSYASQLVLAENTVPNSRTATCNSARFRFGAYATGPPGQYQFPWFELDQSAYWIDAGMHLSELPPYDDATTDWFDGSDWAH